MFGPWIKVGWGVASPGAVLIVWTLAGVAGLINTDLFPTPDIAAC